MNGEKHISTAIKRQLVNFEKVQIVVSSVVDTRHKHLVATTTQNILHSHSAFQIAVGLVVFHTSLHTLVVEWAWTIVAVVSTVTGVQKHAWTNLPSHHTSVLWAAFF